MDREAKREFLMSLRVGDVLRINGQLRILRNVKWKQAKGYPPKGSFTFAIRRCSWTGRGDTTYVTSDMWHWSIELVARNFRTANEVSNKLDEFIRDGGRKVTCCEVRELY